MQKLEEITNMMHATADHRAGGASAATSSASTVTPAPKKARRPKAGSKTAIKRKEEAAQKKDEHVWAAAVEAYRLGHKSASKVLRNTDGTAFESLGHGNRNAVNRTGHHHFNRRYRWRDEDRSSGSYEYP
jgi:hypothetical protein